MTKKGFCTQARTPDGSYGHDAPVTASFSFNGFGSAYLPCSAPNPFLANFDGSADTITLLARMPGSDYAHAVRASKQITPCGTWYRQIVPVSFTPSTDGPSFGTASCKLLERARAWIESHADDETLCVNALASALNMSRTSLHRKLVSKVGQSPGRFIRTVRLQLAHRLLQRGEGNVSQIAYAVGFVSLSGFSRAYRTLYGRPPSSSRPHAYAPIGLVPHGWNKSTSN